MRTVGTVGGKFEHFWSQRRQHQRDGRVWLGRGVLGIIHGIEIAGHVLERYSVVPSSPGDTRRVTDSDTENEAARVRLAQRLGTVGHRHRVARVNVGYARGD